MKIKNNFLLIIITVLLLGSAAVAAVVDEEDIQKSGPAEVEADEIIHQHKQAKTIAKGNVIVKHGGRVLRTDEASYDQNTKIITVEGNVHLEDIDRKQFFADRAEINDELTEGTIENLRGNLGGSEKFAADKGIRRSPTLNILENARYTPCKVCKRKFNGKPLWQITARRITMDDDKERIAYKHATFDVIGVPVLYTPYLSHATPDAKRKSGFLMPSYSNVSTLGFTVSTPYYFNIAPNVDATVAPIFTTEEGVVMTGEFRHLTHNGEYIAKGSITYPKERDEFGNRKDGREFRGHIEGTGLFDLEDNWQWGFDVKRSSDDTYLNRYKFGSEDLLISTAFLEQIKGRGYIGARGISFQGLNAADDPDTTPLILPLVQTHHETDPLYMGSRVFFDGNFLVLDRNEGIESRRLSGIVGAKLPYTSDGGHVWEFQTSLRGDVYSVDDHLVNGIVKEGFTGRIIPEAQATWSYPLASTQGNNYLHFEPVVNVIISPYGGNPNKIPNEDSQELELTDVNLFSNNHFTGLDRVEGGPRANYGFRGGMTNRWFDVSYLFGQSYRTKEDESFTPESGLDDNFSDYVGRINLNIKDSDFYYRFRVDKDDFVLRRNEVGARAKIKPFTVGASYILIEEQNEIFDQQEIVAWGSWQVNDNWQLKASGRRDLDRDGGWIGAGGGVVYGNECIDIIAGWRRDFTRDRDIEPSTIYSLKVSLKGLGN